MDPVVKDQFASHHPSLTDPIQTPSNQGQGGKENFQALVTLALLCCAFVFILRRVTKGGKEFARRAGHLELLYGPKSYPLIGNIPHMITKLDFFKWVEVMANRWGDPFRVWKFRLPYVFVTTYNVANQLLSKSEFNGKTMDLDMIRRLYGGKGLSTNPPHLVMPRRKMLQPGFNRQAVEKQVYVFADEAKLLVRRLQKYADTGDEFDLLKYFRFAMFKIACRCSYGETFTATISDEELEEALGYVETFTNSMADRVLGVTLFSRSDFIYFNLTPAGREAWRCLTKLNEISTAAITHGREERAAKTRDKSDNFSYLDWILDLEEAGSFKDEDTIGELHNFLVALYDTSALAALWAMYSLALNPSEQAKAADELNSIYGKDNCAESINVTAANTKEFKYLELCLKESIRLYPAAPIFPRSTPVDVQLDDGRIIPAGCEVMIMAKTINMQPDFFPEPHQFNPERHLQPIRQFMPFGVGVRNCIGQTHAMYVLKVVTAYLLQEFEWETTRKPKDLKYLLQILLVPENSVGFRIKRRVVGGSPTSH